jgi:hypothetical protein
VKKRGGRGKNKGTYNVKVPPGEKRMGIYDKLMCGTTGEVIDSLHSLESVTR